MDVLEVRRRPVVIPPYPFRTVPQPSIASHTEPVQSSPSSMTHQPSADQPRNRPMPPPPAYHRQAPSSQGARALAASSAASQPAYAQHPYDYDQSGYSMTNRMNPSYATASATSDGLPTNSYLAQRLSSAQPPNQVTPSSSTDHQHHLQLKQPSVASPIVATSRAHNEDDPLYAVHASTLAAYLNTITNKIQHRVNSM